MPYIKATISTPVSQKQAEEFKTDMGAAISVFPGKSERWLMVNVEGEGNLWLAGKNDLPAAMVEVSLFGDVDAAAADKMTALICDSLTHHLNISPDRTYVKYTAVKNWGWNGGNL